MTHMRIGGDDVNLSADFLELSVVVSGVFHFSGAIKGKGCRHENEHIPLAFEGFVGHRDKLAVVESFVFEGNNRGVDEGH